MSLLINERFKSVPPIPLVHTCARCGATIKGRVQIDGTIDYTCDQCGAYYAQMLASQLGRWAFNGHEMTA